jgi:SAM-dependent methyltransferase
MPEAVFFADYRALLKPQVPLGLQKNRCRVVNMANEHGKPAKKSEPMNTARNLSPRLEQSPPQTPSRASQKMLRLRLKLAYARVLGLSRGSYKRVWNSISPRHDLAMIGVAGISNEAEFFASGDKSAGAIKEMLGIDQESVVLEIGCGVGRIGKYLALHCKRWIGTDISSEMLAHARKNTSEHKNVQLIELQECSLKEIPTESVDCLYCTAVFMHLDEWDRFRYVSEAFRVLRPGGRCYFDNLNLAGDQGWAIFEKMSEYPPELRPPNISKSSTTEELRIYLDRAGFIEAKSLPGAHFVAVTGVKP